MKEIKDLLNNLGISKVKLAKYLGVSRQMVYNYLELDSIDKWPKDKRILLYKLLNIEDGTEESLNSIKVNTDYMEDVENKLNCINRHTIDFIDTKGLDKKTATLLAVDNVEEFKYLLGYVSKSAGFSKPNEFAFDEDKQFMFEGIIHSAFTLYNSGGASKSKVIVSRERFVQDIEARNEEKLSRTQQLNTVRIQALRELGYNEINASNAAEVFEKIAEIQSRSV